MFSLLDSQFIEVQLISFFKRGANSTIEQKMLKSHEKRVRLRFENEI